MSLRGPSSATFAGAMVVPPPTVYRPSPRRTHKCDHLANPLPQSGNGQIEMLHSGGVPGPRRGREVLHRGKLAHPWVALHPRLDAPAGGERFQDRFVPNHEVPDLASALADA